MGKFAEKIKKHPTLFPLIHHVSPSSACEALEPTLPFPFHPAPYIPAWSFSFTFFFFFFSPRLFPLLWSPQANTIWAPLPDGWFAPLFFPTVPRRRSTGL